MSSKATKNNNNTSRYKEGRRENGKEKKKREEKKGEIIDLPHFIGVARHSFPLSSTSLNEALPS
jgi:hypothetical protein